MIQLAAVSKLIETFSQAGVSSYVKQEVALLVKWAALMGLAHSNKGERATRAATEEQREAFDRLIDSLIRGVRDADGAIVIQPGWLADGQAGIDEAMSWIAERSDGRVQTYTDIYSGRLDSRLQHQFGTADLEGLGLAMEHAFLKIVHSESRRQLNRQKIEIVVRSLAMLAGTIMDRVAKA